MKPSLSQMKNYIRRGLFSVIDREITNKERIEIIKEFGTICSYCGNDTQKPHFDHVIPGKGNGKYNRVPACEICNSHKKLDKDWTKYLEYICNATNQSNRHKERYDKIAAWITNNNYKECAEISNLIKESIKGIGNTIELKKQNLIKTKLKA